MKLKLFTVAAVAGFSIVIRVVRLRAQWDAYYDRLGTDRWGDADDADLAAATATYLAAWDRP